MLTYYCPNCWQILSEDQKLCPNCGYEIGAYEHLSFEDKLLSALYHSAAERKIMAAQILGNRGSKRALTEFSKILASAEDNFFFLRALLLATAKIDNPQREVILKQATRHSSALIASLARELLEQLAEDRKPDEFDRYTG